MILKSFFRKKSTLVYLLILIVIISLIMGLFISISYLNDKNNKIYQDTSLLYFSSRNDSYNYLDSISSLGNINKVKLLDYNENLLEKNLLVNYSLDEKVMVYEDNKLNDEEVVIYLNKYNYLDNISYIDSWLNNNISFINGEDEYFYKVKSISKSNNPYIKVSSWAFNKIENDNVAYTARVLYEKKANEVYDDIEKNFNGTFIDFTSDTVDSFEQRRKIANYVKLLTIITYIIILIFVITGFVVNKNIISDLDDNIILEYKLGYNKREVIYNIFKRLIILYLIAFLVSLAFSICLILFLKVYFKLYIFLIILTTFLIETIISSFIIKIKIK